jgi:hypothetical protein
MVGLQTSQQDDESIENDPEYVADTIIDAQAYVMDRRHLTGMPYNNKYQMQEIRQDIREYLENSFDDDMDPAVIESAAELADADNAHAASDVAEHMAKEMRESSDPRSPRYWGLENAKPSAPPVLQPKHEQKKPEPMFPKKVDLENTFPDKHSSFDFNSDISGIVKPPANDDNDGYMGGHRFIGGKYDETHMLPHKEVAKLIRSDVKALKKNSSMPADWKVSVKTVTYAGGMHYDISISVPEDSGVPVYRTPTFDDYTHGNASGSIADDIRKDGIDPYNTGENEYNAFMNRHKDNQYRVLTDDARHTRDAVQEVADQYKMSDVNGMVDYSSVHRSSYVNIHNEYKD